MQNRFNDKWYGVTHFTPDWLQESWFYNLWKKAFCGRGWHLLDECASLERHYLYCDACGLEIPIEHREEQ